MAKSRSRVADYAVYLLVRTLVCIIQILSWQSALALARAFAWLLYQVDRRDGGGAADNPRGVLLAKDELTSWVSAMNQYRGGRGTDRQNFLSIWSGSQIQVDRKSNPEEPVLVPHPFVAVVGNLPPRQIAKLTAHKDDEGDGLVERMLVVWPERVPIPELDPDKGPYVSAGAQEKWAEAVVWLSDLDWAVEAPSQQEGLKLRFTEEAKRLYLNHYNAQIGEINEGRVPEHLVAVFRKLTGYAARLVVILHMLRCAVEKEDRDRVDADTAEGAWRLVGYLQSHLRRVHGEIQAGPDLEQLRRLAGWIKRGKKAVFKTGNVLKEVRTFRRAKDVEEALERLEAFSYVRKRLPPQGPGPRIGRPLGPEYEVNPKLLA